MNRLANLLVAAVFLVGIYCPTSDAGQQSRLLWAIPGAAVMSATVVLILWYGMVKTALACSAAAMACLLFFTLITPMWTVTPGTLLPYAALLLLLCADLSKISYDGVLRAAWTLANLVNIGASLFVVADFQPAREFLRAHYSAFYESLVPSMLAEGKPVLMFGSHSIAAFFFFVCFYLHLKTSVARQSAWSYLGALTYLGLLLLLKSVSSYSLFLAGLALLLFHTRRRHALILVVVTAAALGAAFTSGSGLEKVSSDFRKVWAAPESGFQGRYEESGVLAPTFEYIRTNPLRGIGIGFSDSLWYGDSGPVEFLLRGSVPLLVAVYAALWFFFTKNLADRTTAVWVFLIYCSFEIAYCNLLYLRTVCMLPLVIAHLNGLARGPAAVPALFAPLDAPFAGNPEMTACCE